MMLTIVTAVLLLVGCSGGNEETTSQPKEAPAVTVQTTPAERTDFPVTRRFGGNLKGNRQTTIPARVMTTVTEIPVRIGQKVQKNDLLVKFDPGGVQSQYHQVEAVHRRAEKHWNKMQTLYQAGAISETQLDEAETGYDVARADFNAIRQSVEITAPFSGVVTNINVRVGDEVVSGLPIVEIADVESLRLFLEVSSTQAAQLKAGQSVRVVSPVDSMVTMNGQVYSVADAANQATRSFEVECRFPSTPKGFAPGMYVTAEIETSVLSAVLVIPSQALLYRSGKVMVYAVQNDSVVLETVTELSSVDGNSAIEANIAPGQRVVVVGQKNLTPGTMVREAGQ
jgi:RND family efflux transporter MFP subunit